MQSREQLSPRLVLHKSSNVELRMEDEGTKDPFVFMSQTPRKKRGDPNRQKFAFVNIKIREGEIIESPVSQKNFIDLVSDSGSIRWSNERNVGLGS